MNNVSRLEALLRDKIIDAKCIKILKEAGEQVKNDIQNLAPVDTGAYRDSITTSDVSKIDDNTFYIKIYSNLNSGWKNVALGYLLEWGTGIKGEETNSYGHGYPYRQTPWVYYNDRYGRWVFTHGNIARPHFYPGLHLNRKNFENIILEEITK